MQINPENDGLEKLISRFGNQLCTCGIVSSSASECK